MTPAASRAGAAPAIRSWLHAARVPTLPAAVVPVLVGSALASRKAPFDVPVFLVTLLASILIQIGTNLANDYYDFKKGADTESRVGPARLTATGQAEPRLVLRATMVVFGVAALAGMYLSLVGGWPILIIGLASIVAGIAYTGGPYPLGYHGLGDIFVFCFFGLIAVGGTYYLQVGHVPLTVLVAAVPVGLLVTAILVVNNVRDADTDRATGKLTLAARFGRGFGRSEFGVLVLGAYTFPLVAGGLGLSRWYAFWLPWTTLPLALSLIRTVSAIEGPALNRALKGTGQLHLLFGVLFAVSFLIR